MPHRKRREKALDVEVNRLAREFSELRRSVDQVRFNLRSFRPHDDALSDLVIQMNRTLNVLHDRDPDYEEPHRGHMAKG